MTATTHEGLPRFQRVARRRRIRSASITRGLPPRAGIWLEAADNPLHVLEGVLANLPKLHASATAGWAKLRPDLVLMEDVLTLDRASIFEPAKDRPILFSALAWAGVLLTLDRADFGAMLGGTFYDLAILTPGMFLERERVAGRGRSLPE